MKRSIWILVATQFGLSLVTAQASVAQGGDLLIEVPLWPVPTEMTNDRGNVERYEKIPVEEEGGVVTYHLRQVQHKTKGGGGALVALGAGLLVGQLVHDWIGGVRTIELKRDAVRFKYGKSAGYRASLEPTMDLERRRLGAALALRF